jgi:hypothetical protein
MNVIIERATSGDAHKVAVMVGELLNEIMSAIGVQAFSFNLNETTASSEISSSERNISCLLRAAKTRALLGLWRFMKAMLYTPKVLSELYRSFSFAPNSAHRT